MRLGHASSSANAAPIQHQCSTSGVPIQHQCSTCRRLGSILIASVSLCSEICSPVFDQMSLSQSSRRGGNFSFPQSDELSIHNGPENPELEQVIDNRNKVQQSEETVPLVTGSPFFNNPSGMTSCSSNQSFSSSGRHEQASEDEPPLTAGRRTGTGSRQSCQKLWDVKKEHVSDGTAESSGDTQTSTSRRQVVGGDKFFVSHPHNNSTSSESSSFHQDGRYEVTDPCSRWVKRLKQADSGACATRSSEIEEMVATREITESSKASDVTRKHAWIKRWSPVVSSVEKKKMPPSSMLVRETRSSAFPFDDLPRKSFASIAGMALTARSISSFPPCEFRTTGSCTVWHAG